jgi:hypothetical protein
VVGIITSRGGEAREDTGRPNEVDRMKAWTLVANIPFVARFVAGGVGHFVATDVSMNMKMMPLTSPGIDRSCF